MTAKKIAYDQEARENTRRGVRQLQLPLMKSWGKPGAYSAYFFSFNSSINQSASTAPEIETDRIVAVILSFQMRAK